MRNKHGKGKIHPSPSSQQHASPSDCLSALSLLPAAILALTAALCLEDKEVLAYFVTRCVIGLGSVYEVAAADQSRKKGKGGGAAAGAPGGASPSSSTPHAPRFDCGCFGCYTSFWIRWGSSPHGELIDRAIEAFEKHLAEGEGAAAGRKGNKERRGGGTGGGAAVGEKRGDSKAGRKGKKKKAAKEEQEAGGSGAAASGVLGVAEQDAAGVAALAVTVAEGSSSSAGSSTKAVVDPVINSEVAVAAEAEVADRPVMDVGEWSDDASEELADGGRTAGGEKKKPWLDVMGFLNSRVWSLWSPSA